MKNRKGLDEDLLPAHPALSAAETRHGKFDYDCKHNRINPMRNVDGQASDYYCRGMRLGPVEIKPNQDSPFKKSIFPQGSLPVTSNKYLA